MTVKLPDELRNAVSSHPGVPLEIVDEQSQATYVVMPMQVYREMMGVGTDAEYAASLAAIREGLADVDAGRTVPVDEFFRELDRKNGIHD